jgi:hypothetical protein
MEREIVIWDVKLEISMNGINKCEVMAVGYGGIIIAKFERIILSYEYKGKF